MGIVSVSGSSYHMNDKLIKKWDKIKDGKITRSDDDRVYITDGRERSGKSLFTIQQMAYIDSTILEDEDNGNILPRVPLGNAPSWKVDSEWRREIIKRFKNGTLLPRITFNSKETLRAIRRNRSSDNNTKGILFDEAFRGMSSKGVLSKENKTLVQVLMEMGQSNLVLWVVSPSFFLLELYPAMLRSNALFHVKKDKESKKRIVRIFNYRKKALLYQIGLRKGWGYPIKTKEGVNFYEIYPSGIDFEWRYRLKKQLSLKDNEQDVKKEEHKWKRERDLLIKELYSKTNSLRQLSLNLREIGIFISANQIGEIVRGVNKNVEDEDFLEGDEIEDSITEKQD
jgi:hypothetical protein